MAYGHRLERGIMCSICKKVILNESNFKRHVHEVHFENQSFFYKCPKCPNVNRRAKRKMIEHIRKYHPELRGLDVDTCEVH